MLAGASDGLQEDANIITYIPVAMASGGGGLSRRRESQASDNSMRGRTIRSLGAGHFWSIGLQIELYSILMSLRSTFELFHYTREWTMGQFDKETLAN